MARFMNLDVVSDSDSEDDSDGNGSSGDESSDAEDDTRPAYHTSERVRTEAGKAARRRYVNTFFPRRQ